MMLKGNVNNTNEKYKVDEPGYVFHTIGTHLEFFIFKFFE